MNNLHKQLTRRTFLLGATAGISLILAGCGGTNRQQRAESNRSVGPLSFINPLLIPPLAASTLQGEQRSFDLVAQQGESSILPGQQTETWGYNGAFLGPTLRARRGEAVVINFRNELRETTSVHWHGMHLPAAMDGGPHQPVRAGGSWQPHWRINQPAATLWYHPHPHGATEAHVYQGLAGLFILDDEISDGLALPADYGVDDIPLIVQDKAFRRGQLRLLGRDETGFLGDTILVNGTYAPYFEASTERIRLRILNGSTARSYNFGFDDNRDFHLIATDGGLLETPYRTQRIQLSPGERAEIVVELQPNQATILRSYPPELGTLLALSGAYGGQDSFDILQVRAGALLRPSPALPAILAPIERLHERDAVRTRLFRLDGRRINNQRMDMRRIDEIVIVDTTEIWEVYNQNLYPHNFHVHDVQFQILAIDGNPPPSDLAGWKDTIYLRPRVQYRTIMRFSDYADVEMPYMYHCHLLWHEDQGMMGQFVVIEPGAAGEVSGQLEVTHQH